jgi:hypothetical protein
VSFVTAPETTCLTQQISICQWPDDLHIETPRTSVMDRPSRIGPGHAPGHRHPARQDPPYPLEHAFMTGTLTPMEISVPPASQEQEESCVALAFTEQGPLLLYRLSYWTSIRGE